MLTPPASYLNAGFSFWYTQCMTKPQREERVVILVDGSNLYHRLKEPEIGVRNPLKFDYKAFKNWLASKRKLVAANYYVGAVREEPGNLKSKKMLAKQLKLFSELRAGDWKIYLGYILKSDGYHEKGVDVKIAVDLLVGAYEDFYDTAVLVSSDTDLLPAIDKARGLDKTIEYIGFGHKPSFALIKHCNCSRLLVKSDLEAFGS